MNIIKTSWEEAYPHIEQYFEDHSKEAGVSDWEPNVDTEYFNLLDDYGMLLCTLVMDDYSCVGYSIDQICMNPLYKHKKVATNSMIYIHPEYRGRIIEDLLKFVEDQLISMNVDIHHIVFPGNVKPKLGYNPNQHMYSKRLR